MNAKQIFTPDACKKIEVAIHHAENLSSGEIRVHAEDLCKGDPYERAIEVFNGLGMQHTELRNAVLIYVAIQDKKLAIIGDQGIDKRIQAEGWHQLKTDLIEGFKQQKYIPSLEVAIENIGKVLHTYFPCLPNDKDELVNTVSIGT
ncbi:MAG: TPM domain-containing protein [Sphingobacteriia bacterium]|nr:TPM domain-containing protein [Sphingobacteriia bacterium]